MSNAFFYEPFYDLDRLIDRAVGSQQRQLPSGTQAQKQEDSAVRSFKPRMDLHEDKEKNVVTAQFEFPGVTKEDIQIDVHGGRLIVSAETKQSSEHDVNGYAVRERRFGKFSRTLQLPQGVLADQIKASIDNGVLSVTFPKSSPEQALRRISIA
ncbi:hypothetical protein D9619_013044 [Psilocybe cf. subviscida]|uniref:SHSP domain-containing protein n=1 Tax=Psilocybe cf. subviscida TaxID=2480587 RepID=A0A8H5EVK7_9AGAR|nr:hypothetical protein D9619_013044 [Psilocybe cf. subviscida]